MKRKKTILRKMLKVNLWPTREKKNKRQGRGRHFKESSTNRIHEAWKNIDWPVNVNRSESCWIKETEVDRPKHCQRKKNHAKQTYGEIMLLFSFICKKCDDDVDVDERMFFSKGWRQPKSLIELFWRENSRVSVRECAWVSVLFSARCWDERTFEPSACWLFELCSSDRLSYFSTRSKQWMGVESRQTFPTHYIHIVDSR